MTCYVRGKYAFMLPLSNKWWIQAALLKNSKNIIENVSYDSFKWWLGKNQGMQIDMPDEVNILVK